MFNDRRRLRRWAASVLLAWVFGLAMGIANACALGESMAHTDPLQSVAATVPEAHDHEGGEHESANCLDFCEKASVAALQVKVIGDVCAALGSALPASRALSVLAPPEPATGRLGVDSPTLPSGPPLRIAFQRLAL